MGLFGPSKAERQAQEARAASAQDARRRADAERKRLDDAWRAERSEVCARLRAAERAHAAAKGTFDRYAPGPQKTAAGDRLNTTADRLAEVERELAVVDRHAHRNR